MDEKHKGFESVMFHRVFSCVRISTVRGRSMSKTFLNLTSACPAKADLVTSSLFTFK